MGQRTNAGLGVVVAQNSGRMGAGSGGELLRRRRMQVSRKEIVTVRHVHWTNTMNKPYQFI